MKYPRRYPKFAHLGKNLELVIDKALNEPNEEKKVEFANSIAYYMKLTYSNWHKEMVHDATIRNELNTITNGKLEFTSTPNIRHNHRQPPDEGENFNRATPPPPRNKTPVQTTIQGTATQGAVAMAAAVEAQGQMAAEIGTPGDSGSKSNVRSDRGDRSDRGERSDKMPSTNRSSSSNSSSSNRSNFKKRF